MSARLSDKQREFLESIASAERPTDDYPDGLQFYASHTHMQFYFNTESERRRWYESLEQRGLISIKSKRFFRLTEAGRAAIRLTTQVETAIRVTKVPLTKEQRDGLTVKNDVHIPGIAQAETESERETGPSLYEVNMNCMSVLHNNRNASEQKELDLVSEQVTENDEVKEREFKQEEFTRKWLESSPLTHKLNGLIKRKT